MDKRISLFYLFLSFFVFVTDNYLWGVSEEKLKALLTEVDEKWRGDSSTGNMIMQVKTKHYERSLEIDFKSKGEDYFLVKIISPKKEKGTSTLRRKDEIYNYLPKIDKTIKISSGMMSGSWMGSHFTNDDLVQGSQLAEDFSFKLLNNEKEKVWKIELTPKPNAAVVWGKIISEVIMETGVPVKHIYYDEDMKQVRQIDFSNIKKIDGKQIPLEMRVTPFDKPEEFTLVTYKTIVFNAKLEEADFSLRSLKRAR